MSSSLHENLFDAKSQHCLAYWLDSSNVDHYHMHMIETCACVALVLLILIFLQCKKWNMKKFYSSMPASLPLGEDCSVLSTNEHILMHHEPLLTNPNTPHHQYYHQNIDLSQNTIEIHKTSEETQNGDEWSLGNNENHPEPHPEEQDDLKSFNSPPFSHCPTNHDQQLNGKPYGDANEDTEVVEGATVTASSMQTFPFYDDSDSDTDTNPKHKTWNIFAKFSLLNFRRNKKYKKKYGTYPQSILKRANKSASDPILLPCFMKIIYLFFGGVTFKFILASLASNNIPAVNYDSDDIATTILNGIVSFLDNILWYSLSFLLIQKSSSKRAFFRAFIWGFLVAFTLCLIYSYAYVLSEPIAWNRSSILLLIYFGVRVLICIVLTAFMYFKRHNHNRWKRWASLRFLIVFIFIINTAYVLAVISMSLKNCELDSNNSDLLDVDASTNTSALLEICWFTLVELVRNLIQPFILYGTLLKDTDYWRKLTTLITMSSAIEVPRRGGTLDLSIENIHDLEAFARTTRVPVLDFADFELRTPIGRGATASVYRAYYRGYPVACKDLAANLINEITYDSVHRFCREALLFIHIKIQHINIIKFFGICLRPPALYLVFELATHGTLRNLLDSSARKRKRALRKKKSKQSNKNSPLSSQERLWIALDIATGMQVLHHKDIIHRDLNTNNVLVTFMKEEGRLVAKICDFGLARKLRKNHQDRVNSSFLLTPSMKNQWLTPDSLPNTLPFAIGTKKNNYKYNAVGSSHSIHSHAKKNNSLPPLFADSLTISMVGAENKNGLSTTEINNELSDSSKHKKKHKKHKKSKKRKKHKKNKKKHVKEGDESPSSFNLSPCNNGAAIPPTPPPPPPTNSKFLGVPELDVVDGENKSNISFDAPSLGGTLNMVEAGNSLDALTTECGTVAYMAPELLEHIEILKHFTYGKENLVLYTKSIDVYSFGLILWELCTEQTLYDDMDDLRDIKKYVLDGKRPHIPSYILGTYAGLMKDCWSQSPLHRPDFSDIVRRLHVMLGLSRNKSEDTSSFAWTLVDAMKESGRYE